MKKTFKTLAILLSLVLVASAIAACAPTASSTSDATPSAAQSGAPAAPVNNADLPSVVKLGVSVALSGQYSLEGKFVRQALEILKEEVNADGGVAVQGTKIPIDFIYEDNEAKPEIAVNTFRKLIESDKVTALIGPPMSGCLLSAGPIAQAAKIPAIGTMTTNIKVTQVGDFIFRACFIDAFQAKVAAKYMINDMKVKNVAVLSNNADDYSTGLSNEFKAQFTALGGTIIEHQTYAGSDVKDFNVQLSKIKAANPEAIFMPTYYMDVPLILQQARQMGLNCTVLGTDSWDTPEILSLAGETSLQGVEYVSAFSVENPDPLSQAFAKKFREKYNEDPNSNATFAYDSGLIVLEGIRRANSLDGQAIRDAMASLKDFQVATGSITFDENRNPIKDALILRFDEAGKIHYVTTVKAND